MQSVDEQVRNILYQETNKKNEVSQYPLKDEKTAIIYRTYHKKKDLSRVEKNVVMMNKQHQTIGGGPLEHQNETGKIAKVLAGKLLLAEV